MQSIVAKGIPSLLGVVCWCEDHYIACEETYSHKQCIVVDGVAGRAKCIYSKGGEQHCVENIADTSQH